MAETKRSLYQAAYRADLEEEVATPENTPTDSNTVTTDPAETPEERTWKRRYGDLRSHQDTLTEEIKTLRNQLSAAQKQEVKFPSTKEELEHFAQQYPDIYRHVRSIAMTELLQERETIEQKTNVVRENLEKVERELGLKKILQVHDDFEELNMSEQFHEWASEQPKQIQDWLFESTEPTLCIKAIDLYKAEHNFKKPSTKSTSNRSNGADSLVRTKTTPELPNEGNKKIWKESEIARMHPKVFEKNESEIELARAENRIEYGV